MKYSEIIKILKDKCLKNKQKISKYELLKLYKKIYHNDNIKTFENMLALLKQYEIITNYSNTEYLILNKPSYKIQENKEIIKIYKIINNEYKNIKFIVWDTNIINEFMQHYAMNNYIIVEVEKFAIELILTLLKEKLIKKYTIVTEEMYNQNKNMFLNSENILIVKKLNTKSPLLGKTKEILKPTIEKIMVDLYKDKIYEQYQGKELERIYINILENYSVNFKRLYSYAKYRVNLEQYRKFLSKINTQYKF